MTHEPWININCTRCVGLDPTMVAEGSCYEWDLTTWADFAVHRTQSSVRYQALGIRFAAEPALRVSIWFRTQWLVQQIELWEPLLWAPDFCALLEADISFRVRFENHGRYAGNARTPATTLFYAPVR